MTGRGAIAVLAITCGCNQLFGIHDTQPVDGGVDAAPLNVHTYLTWVVPKLLPNGQPDPQLDFASIGSEPLYPELPAIQVGPAADAANSTLTDALYDPSNGGFLVPDELLGKPWRMSYQLPKQKVPVEVAWKVSSAHLAIPRLTRIGADPAPAQSGYSMSPVGANVSVPYMITTGVFTFGPVNSWTSTTFNFDYADNAQPIAGPAGAPQAMTDWLIAMDWGSPSSVEQSVDGWAVAKAVALAASTLTPTEMTPWITTQSTVQTSPTTSQACLNRIVLGAFSGWTLPTTMCGELMEYGLTPSTMIPGFTADGAPIILPLDIATKNLNTLTLVDTNASVPMPHVLYSKVANTRNASATTIPLESSLEVVTTIGTQPIQVFYPAGLARNEMLGHKDGSGMQDLSQRDDPSGGIKVDQGAMRLAFSFENGQGIGEDDIQITLYEIGTTALMPLRVYQVPGDATSALIDGRLMTPGKRYVFSIRTRKGYPNAGDGDYRTVAYPFGQATKFSATFTATAS